MCHSPTFSARCSVIVFPVHEWQKQHNSCQTLSSVEEDTINDADDCENANTDTTATVETAEIEAPVATVPSSPPNESRSTRPLRETRMQKKFDDFVTSFI